MSVDRRRGFVLAATIVVIAAAVAYVGRFGSSVPYYDDWDVVHFTLGSVPVSFEWIWAQHNEHRIPLQRLLHWGLDRAFGVDRRPTLAFALALLVASAFSLLFAALRLRGRSSVADVALPIALLHWGHYANLMWGFGVGWALLVALFSGALTIIAVWPSRRAVYALVGVAALLLPLNGIPGIVLAAPLVLWLLWSALVPLDRPGGRAPGSAFALGFGVAALVVIALYFVSYRPGPNDAPIDPARAARGIVEFASRATSSYGSPWSLKRAAVLLVAAVAVAGALIRRALRERSEKYAGLALAVAAPLALAAAVGAGRGSIGTAAAAAPRYAMLACLLVVATHVGAIASGQRWLARGVPWLLLALLVFSLPWSGREAWRAGEERRAKLAAFATHARQYPPVAELARRNFAALYPDATRVADVETWLRYLARERSWPFDDPETYLNETPEVFFEEPLALERAHVQGTTFDGRAGAADGPDPILVFELDRPRPVAGVRLALSVKTRDGRRAFTQCFWSDSSRNGFAPGERMRSFGLAAAEPATVTIWIDDVIDRFRLDPDNRPCTFLIESVTLLLRGDRALGTEKAEGRGHGRPALR
jgi:hypothetical protein